MEAEQEKKEMNRATLCLLLSSLFYSRIIWIHFIRKYEWASCWGTTTTAIGKLDKAHATPFHRNCSNVWWNALHRWFCCRFWAGIRLRNASKIFTRSTTFARIARHTFFGFSDCQCAKTIRIPCMCVFRLSYSSTPAAWTKLTMTAGWVGCALRASSVPAINSIRDAWHWWPHAISGQPTVPVVIKHLFTSALTLLAILIGPSLFTNGEKWREHMIKLCLFHRAHTQPTFCVCRGCQWCCSSLQQMNKTPAHINCI